MTIKLEMAQWKKNLLEKGICRLVVEIPEITKKKLMIYKAISGETMQEVVRDAIEFYLHCKSEENK